MMVAKGLNLSVFHPSDGDTIVVTYDKELVSFTQFHDSFELIREEFPNHIVIAVPKGMTINTQKGKNP